MLHKYQNNALLLFIFSQWKDSSRSRVADFTRFDVRWRLGLSGEMEDDLPPKISLMIGQSFQDLTRLRSSAQLRERKRGVGGRSWKGVPSWLGTSALSCTHSPSFTPPSQLAGIQTAFVAARASEFQFGKMQKVSVCLFVCFGCLISGLNTTIFRNVTDV